MIARLVVSLSLVLAAGCHSCPAPGGGPVEDRLFTITTPDARCLHVDAAWSGSTARLCVHDAWRSPIASTTFSAGGPIAGAQLVYVQGDPLVRLTRQDGGREHYGLAGDAFTLVRIEDARGRAGRTRYAEIGPPPPQRDVARWYAALASDDRVEVLRTLTWMAGVHHEPLEAWLDDFRARPNVRARLAELLGSKDPWVREQARLAVEVRR